MRFKSSSEGICKRFPASQGGHRGQWAKDWNLIRGLKALSLPTFTPSKRRQEEQLKLLIGLLTSCTLLDWFAINSGVWCTAEEGWRQPLKELILKTLVEAWKQGIIARCGVCSQRLSWRAVCWMITAGC